MAYDVVSEEEMEKVREEFYSNFNDFEKRLFYNLDLLIDRVKKFKNIEAGTLDYWTYYDSILTQIRAMFIETPKRKQNHTIQNYLITINQKDLAKEIDVYLDKEIYEGMTFKEAIKVSVDKFIVHFDKVDVEDIVIEQMCRSKFTEPNKENNISNILIEFMKILMRGTMNANFLQCEVRGK